MWFKQACTRIVVESRSDALEETGDLNIPMHAGLIRRDEFDEIGQIVAGEKLGRINSDELTQFKSVGLAAMDVVMARNLYDRALEQGIGQKIELYKKCNH